VISLGVHDGAQGRVQKRGIGVVQRRTAVDVRIHQHRVRKPRRQALFCLVCAGHLRPFCSRVLDDYLRGHVLTLLQSRDFGLAVMAGQLRVPRGRLWALLLLGVLVSAAARPAAADMWSHAYASREEVPVWVNTVGPFKNPTETYSYFEKLPVCHPDVIQHRRETLGEVMEGNRLVEAGYDVHFRGKLACA
jgi:hypothetical protein